MAGPGYMRQGAASKQATHGVGGGVVSRQHKITFEDGSVAYMSDQERDDMLQKNNNLKTAVQGKGRLGFKS